MEFYEEFDDSWIDAHLDRINRSARDLDDRHERIADRTWAQNDQTVNGTLMSAVERIAAITRLPFRETGS